MSLRSLAQPLAVAAAAAGGCAAIWLANPTEPGGLIPVCPTKALLGIDCPGCGSMRMIYSLLHLDVASALRFNALGVVAFLLLLWAYGAWVVGKLAGRRIFSWQHMRWSAPVAAAVTLAWFVVRNLNFGPFVALHV